MLPAAKALYDYFVRTRTYFEVSPDTPNFWQVVLDRYYGYTGEHRD
jgi:hypothetical protein